MSTTRQRTIFAALAALIAVFHAAAASADSAWVRSLAFAVGYSDRTIPDVDESIRDDLPDANGSMMSFGIVAYMERPSGFGLGLDLVYSSGVTPGDDVDIEWWDSRTLGVLGYAYRFGDFDLGPRIGMGIANMSYVLRAGEDTSADDHLGAGGSSGNIDGVAFIVDGQIQARYHIRRDDRRRGAYVGLLGGYSLSPFETDWRYFNRNVSGGPEHFYRSPYGMLTLGLEF